MNDTRGQSESAQAPARAGWFGEFGGRFASETLMGPLEELETAFEEARRDPEFTAELRRLLGEYVGRPTPLSRADRLGARLGGRRVYLKREDLAHTGAHKINNTIGQGLLAVRMGKRRIIAETGAGQHGVASATAAAALGLECCVYMGETDMARQALNVSRMRLLGAEVRAATCGSRTLKDAINEAMRDWVGRCEDSYYLLGSALGPHPYPSIVRFFHQVIGDETAVQLEAAGEAPPGAVVACVGGGSNAIGIFSAFIDNPEVRLIGVEAGGFGLDSGRHAARIAGDRPEARPGILHGTHTYVLQDSAGQVTETHSVSAGLDYPAIGPEHAHLHATGRALYTACDDASALRGLRVLAETEGVLAALESAHAVGWLLDHHDELPADAVIVINVSGRGDKDMEIIRERLEAIR